MSKIIRLTESDLTRIVKRVIKEQSTATQAKSNGREGRRNPEWIMLVNTLKNLSYPPKILTFNSMDNIPSQSLNWGSTKSSNGKYGFGIESTDSGTPQQQMFLMNPDDGKNQMEMHKWWSQKGYKTDGQNVMINFKDANKLRTDIESFFKVYRPE